MTIQASRLIPAEPGAVWKTMTSRAGMKAYLMGADVETDWQVGHPITLSGELNGKRYEDRGEIRSFEPGRRFSYTHEAGAMPGQTHIVTFELKRAPGGAEVTVTQEAGPGVDPATEAKNRELYEKTWATMLEKLEAAAVQ